MHQHNIYLHWHYECQEYLRDSTENMKHSCSIMAVPPRLDWRRTSWGLTEYWVLSQISGHPCNAIWNDVGFLWSDSLNDHRLPIASSLLTRMRYMYHMTPPVSMPSLPTLNSFQWIFSAKQRKWPHLAPGPWEQSGQLRHSGRWINIVLNYPRAGLSLLGMLVLLLLLTHYVDYEPTNNTSSVILKWIYSRLGTVQTPDPASGINFDSSSSVVKIDANNFFFWDKG